MSAMNIILDEVSFLPAYEKAFKNTTMMLEIAGRKVRGASERAEKAKLDLDDLRTFRDEVARHLREGTFDTLPPLRNWFRRIQDCHHLTVGPWKGIFLVRSHNEPVIGLIFSKSPHNFLTRLHELSNKHRGPRSAPPPPKDKNRL